MQPVEQFADVVGLGRDGHRLEPSEGRHVERRVRLQQPLELHHLRLGDRRQHRLRRAPAGPGAPGDGGALDRRRGRQDDARPAERLDDGGRDRRARVRAAGRLRGGLDHERQVGPCRGPQAEGDGELAGVVGHGLWAARVAGEGLRRDLQPPRHPGHQGLDRLAEVGERRARVAQQGELHGVAEPGGVAPTRSHQVPVGARQGEAPGQAVRVGGDAEQRPALLVGQQISSCHGPSPSRKRP